MCKYFKYCDEDLVICFLELDEEFYCLKGVYETNDVYINTYLIIEDEKYFLPEGSFIDSLDFITEISKIEFSEIWIKSQLAYLKSWKLFELNKKIGDKVNAEIMCFYPQGVILNIGEIFYGLADYETCLHILGKDKMYPANKLDLYIHEFDSVNMLVKLK